MPLAWRLHPSEPSFRLLPPEAPMSAAQAPTGAELASFVDQFVVAVDFQNPVPVAADTKLDDLPEWDSLAALGVIVMCDTDYGVTITGNDLKECVTVGDILVRIHAKKAH
jgi:acyl carrier protein